MYISGKWTDMQVRDLQLSKRIGRSRDCVSDFADQHSTKEEFGHEEEKPN
jgi:hypothetical protein